MSTDEHEAAGMRGQLLALSATLTAVIAALPVAQAEQAAIRLQVELETGHSLALADPHMPDGTIEAREAVIRNYLDLLAAVQRAGD